jgi:hypothetical protein
MAGEAGAAVSTGLIREDHVITMCKARYRASATLDDTCAFVTEYYRHRHRHIVVTCVGVCLADAGGDDPDENLVRPRLVNIEILQNERTTFRFQYGTANTHVISSALVPLGLRFVSGRCSADSVYPTK